MHILTANLKGENKKEKKKKKKRIKKQQFNVLLSLKLYFYMLFTVNQRQCPFKTYRSMNLPEQNTHYNKCKGGKQTNSQRQVTTNA